MQNKQKKKKINLNKNNKVSLISIIVTQKYARFALVTAGFVWALKASVGFMTQLVPTDRKALGVYPVFLFYVTLSWMVLVQ